MSIDIEDLTYLRCEFCGAMTPVSKSEIKGLLRKAYVVACTRQDCQERAEAGHPDQSDGGLDFVLLDMQTGRGFALVTYGAETPHGILCKEVYRAQEWSSETVFYWLGNNSKGYTTVFDALESINCHISRKGNITKTRQ